MEDENGKISLVYRIKGIQPYQQKKGYVAVMLTPVDKLEINHRSSNIHFMNPTGGEIPKEAIQQMEQMMENMIPGLREQKERDTRDIIHIELETDFQKRGWKYGDNVTVTLEKTVIDLPSDEKGDESH